MPFEAACLSYAAFANLARASERCKRMSPAPYLLAPSIARIAGIALLGAALLPALYRFGTYQGIVAWIGMLCLGGIAVVLLMSRWPRLALGLWLPMVIVTIPLAFLHSG